MVSLSSLGSFTHDPRFTKNVPPKNTAHLLMSQWQPTKKTVLWPQRQKNPSQQTLAQHIGCGNMKNLNRKVTKEFDKLHLITWPQRTPMLPPCSMLEVMAHKVRRSLWRHLQSRPLGKPDTGAASSNYYSMDSHDIAPRFLQIFPPRWHFARNMQPAKNTLGRFVQCDLLKRPWP